MLGSDASEYQSWASQQLVAKRASDFPSTLDVHPWHPVPPHHLAARRGSEVMSLHLGVLIYGVAEGSLHGPAAAQSLARMIADSSMEEATALGCHGSVNGAAIGVTTVGLSIVKGWLKRWLTLG